MGLLDVSIRRPLGSYAKVQALISRWMRNRRSQLRSPRVAGKQYLDVGCGPNTHADFINLEYSWHPGIDLCWDVVHGIPLADGSLRGIFSEHCLEHFSLPTVRFLFSEFHRLLSPGGTLRIVVPDAGRYLDLYARREAGETTDEFPYEEEDRAIGLRSPLVSVNRVFYIDRDSVAGHRCMFDQSLLIELMTAAGFQGAQRREFRCGRDPRLLIDSEQRWIESICVEAERT